MNLSKEELLMLLMITRKEIHELQDFSDVECTLFKDSLQTLKGLKTKLLEEMKNHS